MRADDADGQQQLEVSSMLESSAEEKEEEEGETMKKNKKTKRKRRAFMQQVKPEGQTQFQFCRFTENIRAPPQNYKNSMYSKYHKI